MNIKAKMRCSEVASLDPQYNGAARRAKLNAVYGDSEENKTFSAATPSASVEMTITNPDAFEAFVPGAEYYLEFTPVNTAAPAQ